jgi:ornithine cyclodeaminase/alanine dehydrogenase
MNTEKETLMMSKGQVAQAVTSVDIIKTIEEVLAGHSQGTVVLPPKISLNLGEDGNWPHYNGFINAMPGYIGKYDIAGIKFAGGFWQNVDLGLPSIMAVIILNNPHNGAPLAIMDGELITSLRTGATVAVGFKYLWPHSHPANLSIFGAGNQGKTSLLMCSKCLSLNKVVICDINPKALDGYQSWVQRQDQTIKGLTISYELDMKQAASGADLLVTATPAKSPFLKQDWLDSASVIAAIGSYQEVEDRVILEADIRVVDNIHQALHRGNLCNLVDTGKITKKDIYGEIGDIVAGKDKYQYTKGKKVLYVPIGMGSEDIAVAYQAWQEAIKMGIGTKVDLEYYQSIL